MRALVWPQSECRPGAPVARAYTREIGAAPSRFQCFQWLQRCRFPCGSRRTRLARGQSACALQLAAEEMDANTSHQLRLLAAQRATNKQADTKPETKSGPVCGQCTVEAAFSLARLAARPLARGPRGAHTKWPQLELAHCSRSASLFMCSTWASSSLGVWLVGQPFFSVCSCPTARETMVRERGQRPLEAGGAIINYHHLSSTFLPSFGSSWSPFGWAGRLCASLVWAPFVLSNDGTKGIFGKKRQIWSKFGDKPTDTDPSWLSRPLGRHLFANLGPT